MCRIKLESSLDKNRCWQRFEALKYVSLHSNQIDSKIASTLDEIALEDKQEDSRGATKEIPLFLFLWSCSPLDLIHTEVVFFPGEEWVKQ